MRFGNRNGLTYTEIILALPIALLSILAATAAILGAMGFNETARAYTQGMNLGIYRLEEIRKSATLNVSSFSTQMVSNYNNKRFPTYGTALQAEVNALESLGIAPLGAEAITRVSMISSDLADVTVVVCSKDKNGKVIGEDKNFNGILDGSEDTNGNGILDSPITFHTLVARK